MTVTFLPNVVVSVDKANFNGFSMNRATECEELSWGGGGGGGGGGDGNQVRE